jgi:hypothetical protein
MTWEDIDPVFDGDGPDLFINFDGEDTGEFRSEFEYLWYANYDSDHTISVYLDDKFEDWGLSIESLTPDENIVYINLANESDGFQIRDTLLESDKKLLVDFYKTREQKIKDLEQKYKLTLTTRRYGL